MSASMTAYDRGVLQKLSRIPPQSNQPRIPYSPINDNPGSLENDFPRRSGWNRTAASSPIAIGSRSSEFPMDRWPIGNTRRDHTTARMILSPEQNLSGFSSPMDYRNPASDTLGASFFGPNDDPYGEQQLRSPICESLLRANSFDDSRGRPPLSPRKSYDRLSRGEDDLMMDDIPSTHISKLSIRSETPPRSNTFSSINNSQKAGSKRRASSPPNEDRGLAQGDPSRKTGYENNENSHRRSPNGTPYTAARCSPGIGSKFHASFGMHNGSVGSSFASNGTGWSNSLGASSIVSVATSYSTQDGNSPRASFPSPSDLDSSAVDTSYVNTTMRTNRQRDMSLPDRDLIPPKLSPGHKHSGIYVCECCPKKPKKFDSKMDLQ